MRVLRTLIIGAMMVLPGMFLALLVWYLAGGYSVTEPLETLICNGIPLTSIVLVFPLACVTVSLTSISLPVKTKVGANPVVAKVNSCKSGTAVLHTKSLLPCDSVGEKTDPRIG